jgi:prepilin-type processing-associated H-X9-DG protein
MSNLKQMGIAYTQYEQDYDECVPCGFDLYGGGAAWSGQIYPYVKSKAIFMCPNDSIAGDVCSYGANSNLVAAGAVPGTSPPVPASVAKMVSPVRTVLLFEVVNSTGTNASDIYTVDRTDTNWQKKSPVGAGVGDLAGSNSHSSGVAYPLALQYATGYIRNLDPATNTNLGPFASAEGRHNGGANYLLADNHVKWLKPSAVSGGYLNNQYVGDCATTGVNGKAANTACADPTITATFSIL